MAIIFGEIDTLKRLNDLLSDCGVRENRSLTDLISYKSLCDSKVKEAESDAKLEFKEAIQKQETLIENHLNEQSFEVQNRSRFITFIYKMLARFKHYRLKRQLKKLGKREEQFIRKRTSEIANDFFKAKQILDENYALIQGADGEQQALNELSKLPDSYYVINDVRLRFHKPIYYRKKSQRIYSIQADHIVIGPSGVFLIETKNWSKGTFEKNSDFTAFDQIKRTGFALWCFLNPRQSGFSSWLFKPKKISVRSILLMVGQMTSEKERRVIVTDLLRLNRCITWGKSKLTESDVEKIVNQILKSNTVPAQQLRKCS